MRGAPFLSLVFTSKNWIIPADAGSTPCSGCAPARHRDHPRGCGEHVKCHCRKRLWQGSSPRMRGAPELLELGRVGAGIIPADAGSTQKADHQQHLQKDHPRGCGEHRPSGRRQPLPEGSSPRMRGALQNTISSALSRRIIPADAGSTFSKIPLIVRR